MTGAVRTEVLVFAFGASEAAFEGRLLGALERAESGGAIRLTDALFAGRDHGTGELTVFRAHGTAGALVPALTDVRLDPERRRAATAEALQEGGPGGDMAETRRELGAVLAPGDAVAAFRIEHVWAAAVADAVLRSGGRPLAACPNDPAPSEDLAHHALAAVRHTAASD